MTKKCGMRVVITIAWIVTYGFTTIAFIGGCGNDSATDSGTDSVEDTESDTGTDTNSDTETETDTDTEVDGGLDAGVDAGMVPGICDRYPAPHNNFKDGSVVRNYQFYDRENSVIEMCEFSEWGYKLTLLKIGTGT